jgi:hypothetical protein
MVTTLSEGSVIGVHVQPAFQPPDVSGPIHQPALSETLTRLFSLASLREARDGGRPPEVVISVSSSEIGLLEFHLIDAAREAGRRAAQAASERPVEAAP